MTYNKSVEELRDKYGKLLLVKESNSGFKPFCRKHPSIAIRPVEFRYKTEEAFTAILLLCPLCLADDSDMEFIQPVLVEKP